MKNIILVFIFLCSSIAFGQEKLKIEIDNPEPRVGEKITFSINVDFLTDYFIKEIGTDIEFSNNTPFGTQSDDFERKIIFNKANKYKIGPFEFEFNDKKYITDIIEVNVLPELPMENGLWLRAIDYEGEKYLIIEQLISNKSNLTDIENGYSMTVGGMKSDDNKFAELIEELTEGIELSNYGSSSYNILHEGEELFEPGFSYSIKKYKVQFDDKFNGEYIITENDVKNLPDVFEIGKIKLKR